LSRLCRVHFVGKRDLNSNKYFKEKIFRSLSCIYIIYVLQCSYNYHSTILICYIIYIYIQLFSTNYWENNITPNSTGGVLWPGRKSSRAAQKCILFQYPLIIQCHIILTKTNFGLGYNSHTLHFFSQSLPPNKFIFVHFVEYKTLQTNKLDVIMYVIYNAYFTRLRGACNHRLCLSVISHSNV